MKLLWISDFFIEDGISGGAELVDQIYLTHLSLKYDIKKINSNKITLGDIESCDKIILSNFINLKKEMITRIIESKEYIILEHDHKYLSTRDPSYFRNHQAPPRYIRNKELYTNSTAVLCQSIGHLNSLKCNLYIPNLINLGTSVWEDPQYEHLKESSVSKKNEKFAILNSPNEVKNTNLAINYCKENNISYDLLADDNWESFVTKLSKYKGLVFFPKVYESHCRLAVEARMLNLKLLTNENIGATSEDWFKEIKGLKLIEALKQKKATAIQTFEAALRGDIKFESIDRPLVSIVTSMYKGERHVKSFLENMVNQTYFENCELILLDADSPQNEYPIIKPYLDKYDNIHYEKLTKDPGIYGTWNLALQRSTGKYITNANLDDRRSLNQIEELVKVLEFNPNASLAYTECYVTSVDGEDFYNNSSNNTVYPAADFTPESMIKCLPGCMPLWKREIHEKHGLFNENYKMAGDWEMWLRAVKNGCSFIKLDEPLGLYYFNPEGLSTNKDEEKSLERYQEEKDVFWKYTDVFGDANTEHYKGYFSR